MVDVEKGSDVLSNGSCMRNELTVPGDGVAKENGDATHVEAGPSGSGGGMVTYKRRRNTKAVDIGRVCDDSVTLHDVKSIKQFSDQDGQKGSINSTITSNDHSSRNQRDIVLEQICQALESDSGLKKSIQNALTCHPGNVRKAAVKEPVSSSEAGGKFPSQNVSLCDGPLNAAWGSENLTSNGSRNDAVTELCQCTFFDIIMSEKFSELCSLLLENFRDMKAHKLFDLNHISLRIKERTYESSPMLFHSDVQKIWAKLQQFGSDIVAVAKLLSDETTDSFRKQLGSLVHSNFKDDWHEFIGQESDVLTKAEMEEACAVDEVHMCRHCGEKADGRNGLVCDSCEAMYHISCIEPAVKVIPSRSWYCANCTAKGVESPHENCIACERLNAAGSSYNGNEEDEIMYEESAEELEESSNELGASSGSRKFPHCRVCRTEVRNDMDYRICGHSFCPHKFYHEKCLTSKQLISYGPCWYCPSCLCRSCFTDRDDDKIVLCDGCDHAYHIYCMKPPRSSIPRGKWFCQKCDARIKRIGDARRSYEMMQNKSRKRTLNGKSKREEAFNKAGGVDMLLNAAKTLNYEESLLQG